MWAREVNSAARRVGFQIAHVAAAFSGQCNAGLSASMAVTMNLGRSLIIAGIALVACGLLVLAMNRLNLPIGRLPGDAVWRGKNSTVYFPWVNLLGN